MLLTEWARLWGHGAYSELHCESRVSRKTVLKAARDGLPVVAEVAEKLSDATKRLGAGPAGKCSFVSVAELRYPERFVKVRRILAKPRKRRAAA